MDGSLTSTLVIILLNTILTAGLGLIGWALNKLFNKLDEGDNAGRVSRGEIIEKLNALDETVSDNTEALDRVGDEVNGHTERLEKYHSRLTKIEEQYGTVTGKESQDCSPGKAKDEGH